MKRKGQLTIPDLLAVGLLLMVFAVLSPAMMDAMNTAFTNANAFTKPVLVIIIPTILILIIAALWTLQEPQYRY